MLGSTIDAGARRSRRAGRSRGACARLARGREGRARASVTNGTGAWPWERRARRAAARTRRWGIAERHAPGGELLRDDGGHLDFRRRCLKRVVCAGMAWVGGSTARTPLARRAFEKRDAFLLDAAENRDSAFLRDSLPMVRSADFFALKSSAAKKLTTSQGKSAVSATSFFVVDCKSFRFRDASFAAANAVRRRPETSQPFVTARMCRLCC